MSGIGQRHSEIPNITSATFEGVHYVKVGDVGGLIDTLRDTKHTHTVVEFVNIYIYIQINDVYDRGSVVQYLGLNRSRY